MFSVTEVGIEVVGVDTVAVFDAVAEFGIDQFDAELFHQQQDVMIYLRDTGGDGNVEGNRAAVILRHVGRNRISANLFMSLE